MESKDLRIVFAIARPVFRPMGPGMKSRRRLDTAVRDIAIWEFAAGPMSVTGGLGSARV